MMISDFQTKIAIPIFHKKTGYRVQAMYMGSCFTENIGNRMAELKFPVDINPFGILYNPASVSNGLQFLVEKRIFTRNDLIYHNGLWHSFYHHGRFSSHDADNALNTINSRIEYSSNFIRNAGILFITFGTSWVYEYKPSGVKVTNCHKLPDKEFRRFRLSVQEIVDLYHRVLPQIWNVNPHLHIIFTVSPIRHWKDGAIENQRSKSALLLAVEQIINSFGEGLCSYFPAYEIVMDELRDYRFYEEDMLHLSSSAVNHIWKIFKKALMDPESINVAEKVQKLVSAMNHIPTNMVTDSYLNFLNQTIQLAQQLQENYQYLNLTNEKNFLAEKITATANYINYNNQNELP
jgi:hypothetical protein